MQPLYALQSALESGGIKFIDENGGGPGVRLEAAGRVACALINGAVA